MQSHVTWGLIAQHNYWVLSPHKDCFINNSRFKCWLHICFPKELCRRNNSLKLPLFLSCGTGRKVCRVGMTREVGRVHVPSPGEPWPHEGTGSEHGLVWQSTSQTLSFKAGMAELCCSAKPVSKGCWRWRGEAGFPIKGKGIYRSVCGSPKSHASGFCLLQKFKWMWQSVCCEGHYGGNCTNVMEWEFRIVNV